MATEPHGPANESLSSRLSFEVPGEPIPQGSGRAVRAGNGRLHVIADNPRLQPWRDAVTWHARLALAGRPPLEGAVAVELAFTFARPRGHFGRRGLRPSAPTSHTVRPDLDKLCRATLDALVGAGVVRDDAQVAELHATKRYGERPGLAVSIAGSFAGTRRDEAGREWRDVGGGEEGRHGTWRNVEGRGGT